MIFSTLDRSLDRAGHCALKLHHRNHVLSDGESTRDLIQDDVNRVLPSMCNNLNRWAIRIVELKNHSLQFVI